MKVYRIRRIRDGLFSTGGYSPSFDEKGKTWTKNGLTAHLALFSRAPRDYQAAEIIEYEVIEKEISHQSVERTLIEMNERRREKREKEDLARAEEQMKRKQAEFERLKKELGK